MLNKLKLKLLKLFYTLIIKHHGLNAGSLATLFYHSYSLETLDEDNGECISAAAEGSLAKAEKRGFARHWYKMVDGLSHSECCHVFN